MSWSVELQEKMALLSNHQRRAIAMIVSAEVDGVALSRLLKTPYSCQWCGRLQGRSSDKRNVRKALLSEHEKDCERGPKLDEEGQVVEGKPWRFAVSAKTYYTKWRSREFKSCLDQARQEVVDNALGEAARILQIGTPEAARELRRQVAEGGKDFDKRSAAIAVLDRADVSTANKSDPLEGWLRALRDDEPLADDQSEDDDL